MGGLIDSGTPCVLKAGHALVYLVRPGPPRTVAEFFHFRVALQSLKLLLELPPPLGTARTGSLPLPSV